MDLSAYTLMPEPNSTYLYNTHTIPVQEPLSGSTMGLMMLLSSLQYQAPYVPSQYQQAASQAGKAAFIDVGGQATQDQANAAIGKMGKQASDTALGIVHSIGITDTELGASYMVYKVLNDRKIDLSMIKIGGVRFNLTLDPQDVSVGLNYGW